MSSDANLTMDPEPKATPKRKGLFFYDASLEPEIFALQQSVYPQRRKDWIAPRWRWMFVRSAERLGIRPLVCVYRNASGVVAHQGVIPVNLRVAGSEHSTGWFVETMTSDAVRGKPIGPTVIQKTLESIPFNLSLGQTAQMRSIQFALGWEQVAPLEHYSLILNARNVLRGKGSRALSHLAPMGMGAMQGLRRRLGRRRLDWCPSAAEVDRFDARHDLLWERVRDEHACSVVRDSSYLNWKYVDQPGQEFIRLEIRKRDEVVAVAILQILESSPAYGYRRGFVVDLLTSFSTPDSVWAALEATAQACEERKVDLLTFYLISAKLGAAVRSFGFFRREPTRVFLVAPGGLSQQMRDTVLSPESWLITMGDSDIDRPW